jgi:hypothetical protein
MSFNVFARIPTKSLVLLCFAYVWLGWYLAAHHVVWLVGSIVLFSVLAIIRQTTSWLEQLVEFGSRTLAVILFLTISIALVASWSLVFSLIVMPLATAMLADMELRFAGMSKSDRFLLIFVSAGLSLGFGEIIDLLFLPSVRF